MNIVLFGFMGTGKTSIGKRLAERLGWTFADMDELIEQREGKSIADLFAQKGEPYFRKLEKALVAELALGEHQVISTGGGVVLDPENIRRFQACGRCVCLRADEATILKRVQENTQRPLLEQGEKSTRMRALLQQRQPLYDAIPIQLDTTTHSLEDTVQILAEMIP
ncbi:MAG: shikimate kinase [Kiritimatiellae bacterium]|nr:shikimate kinase [Kiritimatiellia bacterium]